MTPDQRELLIEIDARNRALENPPKEVAWFRWTRERWEDQRRYALLNLSSMSQGDDAKRMRLSRALQQLAREKIVAIDHEDGAMHPNVKLTPDGEQVLASLANADA